VHPLRVTFVAPFGVCRRGTTGARVIPLAAALAARGHRVRVVVPDWDCPSHAGRRYLVGAADVVHLGSPRAATHVLTARLLRRTYRAALADEPDVVHCFKPIGYSGAVALLARGIGRRRGWRGLLAVDTDDLEGREGWATLAARPRWQALVLDWQERAALTAADLVTAASSDLVRRATAWRGDHAVSPHYLPNGVDLAPGSAPPSSASGFAGPAHLLIYTRFNEFGPRRGAEMVAAILARVPTVRLVVVGDGPTGLKRQFFDQLAMYGLTERVTDCGLLRGQAIEQVLAQDSVALWLFDTTPVNVARSPVKLLELMASGRPVVAEAVGEVPALAADGARLVGPGDQQALIEAAVQLLENHAQREVLGRHARDRAAGLCWTRRAADLEAHYRSLCT
jgi:glycosyltransferase involved in cell wall biosynthesis